MFEILPQWVCEAGLRFDAQPFAADLLAAAEGGPDLAIFSAIIFLVLLGILGKFAWKPLVGALTGREENIADEIRAAESQHKEAKAALAQYEQKLTHAADEIRELMEEARRDAEHTKTQIVAEAKKAAQTEHERALRDVQNATDAALKTLAEKGASLAVELAGQMVEQKLNASDHRRLIRDAVAKFPGGDPSKN